MEKTIGIMKLCLAALVLVAVLIHSKSEEETQPLPVEEVIEKTESSSVSETKDIREIIFHQLPREKQSLITSWEDATIGTLIPTPDNSLLYDDSYMGKIVIKIDYPLNPAQTPNHTTILVSDETNQIIGAGFVE